MAEARIQIFNADGTLQFDTSNRLLRLASTVQTGTSNGSASVSALSQGAGVAVAGQTTGGGLGGGVQPDVSVSGNTVSWSWDAGTDPGDRLNTELNILVI